MDRQPFINHQHQREASYPRDRYKILDRIAVQAFVYEWVSGKRRVGPHQQRIAVRRLMMDVLRRQRSIGARAILDDDGLSERGTKLVADDAAKRITSAAGTEHRND